MIYHEIYLADGSVCQVNRDSALECFGMLAPTIERNKKYIDKLEVEALEWGCMPPWPRLAWV